MNHKCNLYLSRALVSFRKGLDS